MENHANNESVPMSNDILREMANIRQKYNQQQQQQQQQQPVQATQSRPPMQPSTQQYIPPPRPRPSRTKTKTTSDGIQLGL